MLLCSSTSPTDLAHLLVHLCEPIQCIYSEMFRLNANVAGFCRPPSNSVLYESVNDGRAFKLPVYRQIKWRSCDVLYNLASVANAAYIERCPEMHKYSRYAVMTGIPADAPNVFVLRWNAGRLNLIKMDLKVYASRGMIRLRRLVWLATV